MKILICDDHKLFREGLKKMIELSAGISLIVEAADGKQALAMLGENTIDVALLDLSLPDVSGLELLETINRQWPDVKVVVLTMHSYDEFASQALKHGAACFLNKNIEPEILIEAIKSVYAGKQYVVPELAELLAKDLYKDDKHLPHELLSNRELQVMLKLAAGKTYAEISDELNISKTTVGTHRTNIVERMKIKKNTELTSYCIKNKLI